MANRDYDRAVFRPRDDEHLNAHAWWTSWDELALSYKAAADALVVVCDSGVTIEVEDVLGDTPPELLERPLLVAQEAGFPVAFLYRHYIELRLKQLYISAGVLLGESTDIEPVHPLLPLWADTRARLDRIFDPEREHWDDVESVVAEFDRRDERSFTFRYPVSKDGTPMSRPGIFNLGQLHDAVARVVPHLDGAAFGIEEFISSTAEMMAEMAHEGIGDVPLSEGEWR